MRYIYRRGGARPAIPAEQVAAEIVRVRIKCGKEGKEQQLPRYLWQEAKPENHPLHSYFFDESEAMQAANWRTHKARQLIAMVYIVEQDEKGEEAVFAPAFPSIAGTESRERAYESIEDAIASDEMREQLLSDVKARLLNIRQKYKYLVELVSVWAEIDRVVK